MSNGPSLSEYLASPYIIEVAVVMVLGIGLILPLRTARKIRWGPLTVWRRFMVIVGWTGFVLAALTWCSLLFITVSALRTAVETNSPKPASLVFVIFGGILYLVLLSMSGTAFRSATGSARGDIMEMIGRKDESG